MEEPANRQSSCLEQPYKTDEIIQYEVNANILDAGGEHGDHGFFSHHFGGGTWGWWGAGIMLIMMVPMVVFML
jgi:hypothetical protein